MIAVLHSNSGPRTLELSPKKKFSSPNLCACSTTRHCVTTEYGEYVPGQYIPPSNSLCGGGENAFNCVILLDFVLTPW